MKPQAGVTKELEPTEGVARVTRQLIDELKKETPSMRRAYNEKVKRTRGCSLKGLTTGPPYLVMRETSGVSYSRPASAHRTKKNKSSGPAGTEQTPSPELHELRRSVQSQAAQIRMQDQLHHCRASPTQEEEPEGSDLVTAEHHRACMTFCGVDPHIDVQGNMDLQAYLEHISPKWSLQWWKKLGARKEMGVGKEIARALRHFFASTVHA